MPGASASNVPGILIQEADGSPSGFVSKLIVSNGSLAISSGAATLSISGVQTIGGFAGTSVTTGLMGGGNANPTRHYFSRTCTLRNVRVYASGSSAAGTNGSLTLRLNGGATTIAVSMTPTVGAVVASNLVNTLSIVAGDYVDVVAANGDTCVFSDWGWTVEATY